ncbi:MAG: hypothetical protein ABIS18_01145 [Actinomycetota bacterium]
MESRRDHRISIAVGLALSLLRFTPAFADEQQPPQYNNAPTVIVSTDPNGAVVEAGSEQHQPGSAATPTSRPKRNCYLQRIDVNPSDPSKLGVAHPDDQVPYWLICDGVEIGVVWRKINPSASGAVATTPRDTALRMREEIPIPSVTVRVNPQVGLVGTESWFWVDGYSGQPINESTNALGQNVDVEASVTRYEWIFGDGTSLSGSSLGRPFPQRSDVNHIYERSSAGSDGFDVEIRFIFAVRYRVGGGPWIELPGISRTARLRYLVEESQAVISR